jgi:cytochrome P450
VADMPNQNGYDPYSFEVRKDPYPHYEELRKKCPVHHHVLDSVDVDKLNANPLVARPTTEFWSVTRYHDCVEILQNAAQFASGQGPGPERLVALDGIGMLIYADEPHHTRQRRIVSKGFAPRIVEVVAPKIQALADDLVDGFAERGEVDATPDYANAIAMGGICEMLGVPASDRPLFRKWTEETIAAFGGNAETYDQSFSALMELSQYFMAEIERRRQRVADGKDVPDDILSALVFSPYEERQFNDVELIMACQIILVAGNDTTTHAIGNAINLLCTHPEERAKLEADWSLLDNAMEEVIRFEPPVQGLFRTTTAPTEIAGCPIPEDAKVRVMYASANRDTDYLPDADEFHIDRDPKMLHRHLGFGFGPHGCLGSAMGRMELRTAVRTLFTRLPDVHLDPDRPPQRLDAFFMRGFETLPLRWTPPGGGRS